MRNFIFALTASAVSFVAAQAGDAPKAQVVPVAKAAAPACNCATVEVARPATLRERRSLVVVEKVPVKVVEVKKVEVVEVKKVPAATCETAVVGRRHLLGGLRSRVGSRTAAVVECASCK